MFCMDLSFQVQAGRPKPIGQREGPKNRKDHFNSASAFCSFMIGSAFVDTSISVKTRPKKWPPYHGLSLKLSFKRV